ncbi:flagellar hook-basal body complex protein FliE [Halomonas organivorans]|uniref:Flagellar hook-basal body complex protein FliE n=1 Tax=Halomonas organivorans TaxID=257772 RepID=A0A7W5G4R2_9GAMM|nr:flagellar hook-basal body complex protein FliE [Halomonas organivorans]MBB3140374.1 flagellar hook-basal body complex protein FliE [Halomonas organivorans]
MSSPALASALAQMQSLATQAGGDAASGQRVDTAVGNGGFAGELQASIQRINDLKLQAGDSMRAFQSGEPGVELDDVMVDMQKASVASEMGIQVRNRLVTAYKDVMNMQV